MDLVIIWGKGGWQAGGKDRLGGRTAASHRAKLKRATAMLKVLRA